MEDPKALTAAFEVMNAVSRRELQAKAAGEVWMEAAIHAVKAKVEAMNATMTANTTAAAEVFVRANANAGGSPMFTEKDYAAWTRLTRIKALEKVAALERAVAAAKAAEDAWNETLTTEANSGETP